MARKQTYSKADYATGIHERWSEAVCAASATAAVEGRELTLDERKTTSDSAIAALGKSASDFIRCVYCEEAIALATLSGQNPWKPSPEVRKAIEDAALLFDKRKIRKG